MSIEIQRLGSGISLQDGGRKGWRRYGVPQGGAMDHRSMIEANRLLGNRDTDPVLEIRQQGTTLKLKRDLWLALAGAGSCLSLKSGSARLVKAGEVLVFSEKQNLLYSYLAAPGGWCGDQWFGSVSIDPRNGLGEILKPGDELSPSLSEPKVSTERVVRKLTSNPKELDQLSSSVFKILPGPQFDTFSAEAKKSLIEQEWTISPQSDRTGFRLNGGSVDPASSIKSEPVRVGSFQVPDNGKPIVTMVDGPTVGGYPKIAILRELDCHRFAQCPPGATVSFQWEEY